MTDKPLIAGFLWKKGKLLGGFQERFYELRNEHLYVFKSQTSPTPSDVIIIEIQDRLRVDFCEESGYWGFTLHLKKEDRQFFCKSEDDRKVWVKAIKTSINRRLAREQSQAGSPRRQSVSSAISSAEKMKIQQAILFQSSQLDDKLQEVLAHVVWLSQRLRDVTAQHNQLKRAFDLQNHELMQRDRLLTDADMQIAERDVRIAQLESELDGIALQQPQQYQQQGLYIREQPQPYQQQPQVVVVQQPPKILYQQPPRPVL